MYYVYGKRGVCILCVVCVRYVDTMITHDWCTFYLYWTLKSEQLQVDRISNSV